MDTPEVATVKAFISAINAADVQRLAKLMTRDHTFVDAAGNRLHGREKMEASWTRYFKMYPDYVIHVDDVVQDRQLVAVFGSSSRTYNGNGGVIPENKTSGPAAWKAVVQDGLMRHWQVYADWTEDLKIIARDQASS